MIVQYSKVENDDELREYCIQVRRRFFDFQTYNVQCIIGPFASQQKY